MFVALDTIISHVVYLHIFGMRLAKCWHTLWYAVGLCLRGEHAVPTPHCLHCMWVSMAQFTCTSLCRVVCVSCVFLCSFLLQYFDTVGWVFWPVKTYAVLVET